MSEIENLQNSLNTYNAQLKQVSLALSSSNESNSDLIQLKIDLEELIELTEESLNKQQFPKDYISEENQSLDDEFNKFYSEINEDMKDDEAASSQVDASYEADHLSASNSYEMKDEENDDGISGTKCRLEYEHEWGEMTKHNAVILSSEEVDGEIMVRVMFCNPTHNSMKPCEYYLEDNCKYEDNECRFSHGHLISIDRLMPYKEPDYTLLNLGALCLAKDSDDLWYKATVVDILEDNMVQISFIENGNLATMMLQHLFPLASSDSIEDEDDNLYSSSSSSESDVDEVGTEEKTENKASAELSSSTTLFEIKTSILLGDWEQHTKGIGSKLMEKMGYIVGQGLGRNSDGRAEPIPIQLLPQGKSLDQIMQYRERSKNGTFDIFKKGRRKFKFGCSSTETKIPTVFNFINVKLNNKQTKERTTRINKKPNSIVSITTHDLTKKSDKHINVQLLKTEDEICKTEIEITKLNSGLERNLEKKDTIAANKIRQKIAELQSYSQRLKTSEKFMSQQKLARKARKELTVF